MRVALVHDWLTGMRGGEKVARGPVRAVPRRRALHAAPRARIGVAGHRTAAHPHLVRAASALSPRGSIATTCRSSRRRSSAGTSMRFDLVLSCSHCAVKSVLHPPRRPAPLLLPDADALRLGPVRRLLRRRNGWARPGARSCGRSWPGWPTGTAGTADRVDRYVAISHHVAGRIGRYYNREASVVYPPVDTAFFRPDADASRGVCPRRVSARPLQAHRRGDRGVRARRVPLRIVGDGPGPRQPRADGDRRRPDSSAACRTPTIRELYRRAAVVLLPGEEDFGIVPLEAQACGRPVVALGTRRRARNRRARARPACWPTSPASTAFADAVSRALAAPLRPAARSGATRSDSAASGSATRSRRSSPTRCGRPRRRW